MPLPPQGAYDQYGAAGYNPTMVSQQRQRIAQEVQRRNDAAADEMQGQHDGDKGNNGGKKMGLKGLFGGGGGGRKKTEAQPGNYDYSAEYSPSNDLRGRNVNYATAGPARATAYNHGQPGH